jgi:hypothetical protein
MDSMDWDYDLVFRFLDLPPELRNLIYQLYLQDNNQDHQLDITKWPHLAPSSAIIAVSKQVRSESLGYFTTSLSNFFNTHDWYLPLSTSLRQDHERDTLLSTLHAVPKKAAIRELQFSITSFRCSRRGWPIPVVISVSVDDESWKPVWNFRILGNPNAFAIVLVQAWLDKLNQRAERYGIKLIKGGVLNVGNCVQVFMGKMCRDDDHFENLSMFFVA